MLPGMEEITTEEVVALVMEDLDRARGQMLMNNPTDLDRSDLDLRVDAAQYGLNLLRLVMDDNGIAFAKR